MTQALIPADDAKQIAAIDQTIQTSRAQLAQADAGGQPVLKALILARAIAEIRQMMTPNLMRDVMSLAGSPLGFRTDRDNDPPNKRYTAEELRDAIIEAALRGLRPTGNEFNVISGKCYMTKEGLERLVREWPGLARLQITIGVPESSKDGRGALVPALAKWVVDHDTQEIRCERTEAMDTRLPVRVNSSMGIDAIIGKAKRKLMARIYERLTGSVIESDDEPTFGGPEPPVEEPVPVPEASTSAPEIPSETHQEAQERAPGPQVDSDAMRQRYAKCETLGDIIKAAKDIDRQCGDDESRALNAQLEDEARERIRQSKGQRAPARRDLLPQE